MVDLIIYRFHHYKSNFIQQSKWQQRQNIILFVSVKIHMMMLHRLNPEDSLIKINVMAKSFLNIIWKMSVIETSFILLHKITLMVKKLWRKREREQRTCHKHQNCTLLQNFSSKRRKQWVAKQTIQLWKGGLHLPVFLHFLLFRNI